MARRRSDQFGTPSRRDGTASLERSVTKAAEQGAGLIKNWQNETFPRAIGSKQQTTEETKLELSMMTPEMIAQMAAEHDWSLETFVDFLEKHR